MIGIWTIKMISTTWQDIVIMLANVVLSISLIPQLHYGFKKKKGLIKLETSIPTTLGLYTISAAFFTISLVLSAAVTFVAATFWLGLLIQRIVFEEA